MATRTARAVAVTAAGLLTAGVCEAWAGTFDVNPVRLLLSASEQSGLFTVRNSGVEMVRFQVSAFSWDQSKSGEMLLSPTQDLVFFPAMFTVPPGTSRKIRVGATVPFAATEKSYRVFVEELPPLGSPGTPGAVRVLTRMGMPVFLAPPAPKPVPSIRALALQGRTLSFSVHDGGNAHFVTHEVRVSGRDAGGRPVFERKLSGWYVLAGGDREYRLDIPPAACAGLASVTVVAETDEASAEASHARAPDECR